MLLYLTLMLYLHRVSAAVAPRGALGGAREQKILHDVLFGNYSTTIRPCHDYSNPTNVTVWLTVGTILGLDIKNQILSLNGFMSFTWRDELLTWNPGQYGGIQEIIVPQIMVWRPDVAIYNSIDDRVTLSEDAVLVFISSDGTVRWEPVINLDVTCKVDISKYPFDENVCTINVTSWMSDNATVKLATTDQPIILDDIMANGQFWVSSEGTFLRALQYGVKHYVHLSFKLKLRRRPAYLAMTLLTPVTLLAVLCVVSFFLSPEEPEKVSVAITVLLSFTVFLGVIDTGLPETSDNMCLIVVYVDSLLLLSFLCVAGNAMVIVIHRRDLKSRDLNQVPKHSNVTSAFPRHQALAITDKSKHFLTASNDLKNLIFNINYSDSKGAAAAPGASNTETPTRAEKLNRFFLMVNIFALLAILVIVGVMMMD